MQEPGVNLKDSFIQWLHQYPVNTWIMFYSTYSVDSDLSNGKKGDWGGDSVDFIDLLSFIFRKSNSLFSESKVLRFFFFQLLYTALVTIFPFPEFLPQNCHPHFSKSWICAWDSANQPLINLGLMFIPSNSL